MDFLILLALWVAPFFYSGDSVVDGNLELLNQNPVTRPCVQWVLDHDTEFIRGRVFGWAAEVGGNKVYVSAWARVDPLNASIMAHEIMHNMGWRDPAVYDMHLVAARVLGVSEDKLALIESRGTGAVVAPCGGG